MINSIINIVKVDDETIKQSNKKIAELERYLSTGDWVTIDSKLPIYSTDSLVAGWAMNTCLYSEILDMQDIGLTILEFRALDLLSDQPGEEADPAINNVLNRITHLFHCDDSVVSCRAAMVLMNLEVNRSVPGIDFTRSEYYMRMQQELNYGEDIMLKGAIMSYLDNLSNR